MMTSRTTDSDVIEVLEEVKSRVCNEEHFQIKTDEHTGTNEHTRLTGCPARSTSTSPQTTRTASDTRYKTKRTRGRGTSKEVEKDTRTDGEKKRHRRLR